jgi:hypothetical protein
MNTKLHLPKERIDHARELASRIAAPVAGFIDRHSSVTVERAALRLAGADGANPDGVPVPNLVVDQLRAADPPCWKTVPCCAMSTPWSGRVTRSGPQ